MRARQFAPFLLIVAWVGHAPVVFATDTATRSGSGNSNATDVFSYRVRDKYAQARFNSHTADPGDPNRTLITDVFVVVNMGDIHSPGEGWRPNPDGRALIAQCSYAPGASSCTPLLNVDAQSFSGTLDISRDLSVAKLVGTFTTIEGVTISADLVWSATSPIDGNNIAIHNMDPPSPDFLFIANVNGSGSQRQATATGTVSIGSTNYVSTPSRDAYTFVGVLQGGVINITREPDPSGSGWVLKSSW